MVLISSHQSIECWVTDRLSQANANQLSVRPIDRQAAAVYPPTGMYCTMVPSVVSSIRSSGLESGLSRDWAPARAGLSRG